jgi:peptidoglycan/LPS O-acetylase OafA/YrhL
MGLASYSLFLWHEPITRVLAEQGLTFVGRGGFAVNIAVVAVVSGALAAATYRLVERPALARKRDNRATAGNALRERSPQSPAPATSQTRRTSLAGEPAGNGRRRERRPSIL